MEGTVMEVNLCPSTNIGKASCSVHTDVNEDSLLFSKNENLAVVRLEHSVTAVCPENGEIQFMTVSPDKNIEYNPKGMFVSGEDKRSYDKGLNFVSYSAGHLVTGTKTFSTENKLISRAIAMGKGSSNTTASLNHGALCDQKVNGSKRDEMGFICGSRKRKNSGDDSGPEDEKKPRKNKQWSRMNMLKAIEAVQEGMRVRTAAKKFKVPRTTLKYKLDSRRTLEESMDSPNYQDKRTSETSKEHIHVKDAKRKAPTPLGTQVKNKNSTDITQKNSDLKEQNLSKKPTSCERNNDKSDGSDMPVQHTRSLRSNSRISENKGVQPSQLTENVKKIGAPEVSKNIKEEKTLSSSQKITKANQSTCDKDMGKGNEKKVSKNEETKCGEKKCFKLWSEEAMSKAISAVIEKGSKLRVAAAMFGIPRSTLGRRIMSSTSKAQVLAKNGLQGNDSEVRFMEVRPRRITRSLLVSDTVTRDPANIQSSTNSPSINRTVERKVEEKVEGKERVESVPESKNDDEIKEKGRQRIKNWTEESMEKALEAVEQGMTLCVAAKEFDIPRASLKTRKYKRDNIKSKHTGPEPHISTEDEDLIVNYVNDCATFGIVSVKKVALLLAAEAAEKNNIWDIKKQGLPSDEWWDTFCLRRGSQIKNVDVIQSNQQIKVSEGRFSLFYDKLSAIKNSSQYHKTPLVNCIDCRTFTVQEFKYDLDDVTEWVCDSHQTDACSCKRPDTDPENKLVSTICCASAAGNSIPPMFVYHTENNYKIPATGLVGPFGAAHFVHKVHDLTRRSDYYFKWFQEVFLKYALQSRPLIMLFDPDTAFITPELIQLAHKNEIILLGLPPFSAHVTQPLNSTVFPALKKGFTFTSSLFKRIFVKGVNFNNFARCFKVAWNSSVDAAIIKSGFAEAGIHPLDRKVILNSNQLS